MDVCTLSGATQLLEQAERHAASEHAAAASDPAAAMRDPEVALVGARPARETERHTQTGSTLLSDNRREDEFNRVQTLQLSPELSRRLVSLGDQDGPAAEAFRFLGVRLRHLRRDRTIRKLLVTSTIPQEGKSLVAANLACTLSLRTQQRTLLMEGDLRRPSLTEMFRLDGKPGICEWLRGDSELTGCMYRLANERLWIMPAGSSSGNYMELLQSGKISSLIEETAESFDWVIIDSPPILPLADTSIWSRLSDGILLVTRHGKTEKRQLQRGLDAIESQKLVGAVLNSSSNPAHGDYY